jgi:hypothetical protein
MTETYRGCIEAPLYRSQKAELQPDPMKFDEVEALYHHVIARRPTAYHIIDGTPGWRRLRTRAGIGGWSPSLYLYYSILSEHTCELQAVERADAKPSIVTFFDRA